MNTPSLRSWRALFWEPVAATGERLMAGVIYESSTGDLAFQRTLREDVLRCLYGSQAESASNLIDFGISLAAAIIEDEGFDTTTTQTAGIHLGPHQRTEASTDYQLQRTAVLLHSSLSMLNESDAEEDEDNHKAGSGDESNSQFSTKIKDFISLDHPELAPFFNQSVRLIENGPLIRFGFISEKAIVHFNVITAQRASTGISMAKTKLWELNNAKQKKSNVALINAFPSMADPTLTDRQIHRLQENKHALEMEAQKEGIQLYTSESIPSASERLLEVAMI